MTDKDNNKDYDPSRRRFVKNTGMVVGGVAGGSLLGGLLTNQFTTEDMSDGKENKSQKKRPMEARMFFTRYDDFVVLEQATERIFPEDDNGPGAIELGVPYFIDRQMAGQWGMSGSDYRQGPFPIENPPEEQSSLNRGQILTRGIRKMNQESQNRFDTSFDEADEDQQIEILQDFESSEIKMNGINSGGFFGLLRELTLEGAYSDPLYGGNRDMKGWEMQQYPGDVSSYADTIEEEEFIEKDPVSLTDYQRKS